MKRSEGRGLTIKKLLIANRGEIACRIIATCKKLQIKSVAVYSSADHGALHTQLADEAVHIGEATPSQSYLNIGAVLAAAKKRGADAIHPGYGFLSENSEFASACEKGGITFVGPSSEIIALMGNKIEAKELAQKAKVPLVAGISLSGDSKTWSKQAEKFASEVGYPLLVKASFGGGGRGMRIVDSSSALGEALASASREAQAFFGNGAVFLEKLLTDVRHVEVQVLGDKHGHLFTLFDRDCSLQRNHQKVIEEAPAPLVKSEIRKKIHQAAASLCQNAGYTNAGTVEFLLDQTGNFYFLEVNSRLQVEHPITEAITGLDLVELQIRAAQGEDLSKSLKSLDETSVCGHAIECRICAEAPEDGFMPSSGKIELIDFPPAGIESALRIDSGFCQGSVVSHYYDSLICKVIVHGSSREVAIKDSITVLKNSSLFGVKSNISYLIDLLSNDSFQKTKHHIKFAETILPAQELRYAQVALVGALATLGELCPSGSLDSWQQNNAWRMFGASSVHRSYSIANFLLDISVAPAASAGTYAITVNSADGAKILINAQGVCFSQSGLCCVIDGQAQSATYGKTVGPVRWLRTEHGSHSYVPHQQILKRSAIGAAEHGGVISSSLPGRIVAVKVKAGDDVASGSVLVVVESMKMEHPLTAPFDGKVSKVSVKTGDSVEAGAILIELAPNA